MVNPDVDAPLVWRGVGQGMSLSIQGFSGASSDSRVTRTRHSSNTRFKSVRAVLQTKYVTGNPQTDQDLPYDYDFQVAFEQGYTNAVTGIPERKLFKFGGNDSVEYRVSNAPTDGYIISDPLVLDNYVEGSELFGLWTTVNSIGGAWDTLPYQRNGSNFIQRYVGADAGADLIASNAAKSATSITSTSTSQSGVSNYFSPIMLLIETDSTSPFIAIIGDSIGYGVGEGTPGSSTNGDALGDSFSSSGAIERPLYSELGFDGFNMCVGGMSNKEMANAGDWPMRRALLALANPTHVINMNVHNDTSIGNFVLGRQKSQAYFVYDVIGSGGNTYFCNTPGVSGTVDNLTGTGDGVVDGTCVWTFIAANNSASAHTITNMTATNDIIKGILPNAPIFAMLGTPDASSTDGWLTVVNQTAANRWGDATSKRGITNTIISGLPSYLNVDYAIDPNIALESSPNTSLWVADGVDVVTSDGTHPNSTGYSKLINILDGINW
jgi:lysophospholipase L1-like esterase